MKFKTISMLLATGFLVSCNVKTNKDGAAKSPIKGTWKLISGVTITKGVSSSAEYPTDQIMIKIINDTHFAFLKHRLNTPKDSSNKFDAGGGAYTLTGDKYTEHLDYYSDKNWEGKTFDFTVVIKDDSLIQTGIEKVENAGIERKIIEKYVRLKN